MCIYVPKLTTKKKKKKKKKITKRISFYTHKYFFSLSIWRQKFRSDISKNRNIYIHLAGTREREREREREKVRRDTNFIFTRMKQVWAVIHSFTNVRISSRIWFASPAIFSRVLRSEEMGKKEGSREAGREGKERKRKGRDRGRKGKR